MSSLTFSGHETFACRHYWLKKGYDFVASRKKFSSNDAVVELGVGNNMVRSIRYWLKAFDIVNENDEPTELGNLIFGNKGWDPFLEDEATLWLLHYLLNKKKRASIYSIVFSKLRKQKPEFTRKHFLNYVVETDTNIAESTLKADFSVFNRTYLNDKSKDIEDGYAGLLSDLNLLREIKENKEVIYNIENKERSEIPSEIILFSILDNENYGNSISFDNLYLDEDGPGTIFAINKEGLVEHLSRIAKLYSKTIVFKNDPLARELQFKETKPDLLTILKNYYSNDT